MTEGRIQHKGTDLCADFYCDCGERWHEDGEFLTEVECPTCDARYVVGDRLTLEKIEKGEPA